MCVLQSRKNTPLRCSDFCKQTKWFYQFHPSQNYPLEILFEKSVEIFKFKIPVPTRVNINNNSCFRSTKITYNIVQYFILFCFLSTFFSVFFFRTFFFGFRFSGCLVNWFTRFFLFFFLKNIKFLSFKKLKYLFQRFFMLQW